jgi:hypothetical protein
MRKSQTKTRTVTVEVRRIRAPKRTVTVEVRPSKLMRKKVESVGHDK